MKKAPERLRFAAIAVDAVVFGFVGGKLCGLVSAVNRPPHYVNTFGFLGGLIEPEETAKEASVRVLRQKGSLTKVYLEQLHTFSAVERDKRNRVVSVAYLGLVCPEVATTYKHEEARFVSVKQLVKLAYDHNEMLTLALSRLKGKLTYTTIAQFLLPQEFTFSELQEVYEIVLRKELDKRNFRKKILALDILKETGNIQAGVKNRPAAFYTFKDKKIAELSAIV
jgi:8-oxo-dGTP diphosphatase